METIAIGVDIINIKRLQKYTKDNKFYTKTFTEKEINECQKSFPEQHFAGKLAAKEAVSKCFSCNLHILEVEILTEPNGKPKVNIISNKNTTRYYNPEKDVILVSISHDGDYAIAYANLLSY